jgi:hypothetical protein
LHGAGTGMKSAAADQPAQIIPIAAK